MNINVLQKARAALDHYVYLMTQNTHKIQIWVLPEKFDVQDPELDDAYKIEVESAEGNIWASNPRAALIAVYHFLRENGCGFVRPGAVSERIPLRTAHALHANFQVNAAHRFRGICIEGSCNLENTLDLLNSVYTRSGQNSTPNSNATNLHSSQKRCCSFCISSSNASPTFQVQKSIFHQMTKPIQVTVILPLLLAISFSRNDDIHSSISGISNDLIGVIPTIGQ